MLETLLIVFVTGIAGLVAFLVFYARWHYGSLEKLGIPVAKPHFLLGSDPDGYQIVYQERDMERFSKFGPVFGVYEGRIPRVFVVEPDMIRRIMVKDFDHFYDRTCPDWGHEIFDNIMDFLPGEKWKTMRSAITPMFTSSRIRNGGKMYVDYMDKYVKELGAKFTGASMKLDMKEFMTPAFVEFTSDYFLAIKLSADGNIKENYVYKMVLESMGDDGQEANFMYTLMTVYPFILRLFNIFPQDGIKKFLTTLDQVIKSRKESKVEASSGKDFIDVMVSMLDKLESPEFKRLGIEKITIQAQAFEMFVAGFDSIVGTLTILPYYLAKNPEIQQKVLEEVDECYSVEKSRKDNALPDLPFLTACIREAIRLYPSFHRLERMCTKDWTYNENGINVTIPQGMSVVIPAWATNRNPKAFKDPEEFRPERYFKNEDGIDGTTSTKEEHNLMQYAMTSFGHGPRNCPGSRMGIEMIKAGMARMLQEFTFECREDTKVELQNVIPMITRFRPLYLDVVKRIEQ